MASSQTATSCLGAMRRAGVALPFVVRGEHLVGLHREVWLRAAAGAPSHVRGVGFLRRPPSVPLGTHRRDMLPTFDAVSS
jgi:hypothetical protein